MKIKVFILWLFAALALTDCSYRETKLLLENEGANGSRIPSDTMISIDSFSMLGESYMLVIFADGSVVYTPTKYPAHGEPKQGVAIKSKISPEQLEQIIREFERSRFFSLKDAYLMGYGECTAKVKDGGSSTISIESGGRKKSVEWNNCHSSDGKQFPEEFMSVSQKISETTGA